MTKFEFRDKNEEQKKDLNEISNKLNQSEILKAVEAMKSINSLALDYSHFSKIAENLNAISKINIPIYKPMNFTYPEIEYNYTYEIENSEKIESIKSELNTLNKRNLELITELENKEILADEKSKKIEELEQNNKKILEDTKLIHITSRIHQHAAKKLLENIEFREKFNSNNEFEASVISIDIRRSTDLMLESRSPADYSEFIFELTNLLKESIIKNYGIFDKFTGDGILAFFPKFYSGEHSILYAQKAANEAHSIFETIYKKHRKGFNLIMTDVGLGIGIDYGKVNIYQTNSELSIVGKPVVYACRFSSTPAYTTLNNHGVILELEKQVLKEILTINERILDIKNKGNCLGFDIEINWKKIEFIEPNWSI